MAIRFLFAGLLCIAAPLCFFAQSDTAGKKTGAEQGRSIKIPKHYFTPTFFMDLYATPKQELIDKNISPAEEAIKKRLKDYQYSQSAGGFYFPVMTREKVHADERVSNFHLLVTGSYLLAMPRWSGISTHNLMKASLGLRGIYNSGKKGIWFFDATPFTAGDLSDTKTMTARWASTILYDHMVSPAFSYRVGVTRTFILGNRWHLPYLGMRIGQLDKTYFSIQFPRSVSFSFPMGAKLRGSIYSKVNGNLLAMSNSDTLYNGTNKYGDIEKTIFFGRYEGNSGMRLDFNPSKHFSFFIAFGTSTVRGFTLISNQYNKKGNGTDQLAPFYGQGLKGTLFVNFGLTVRIGQARSVYKNYNMYEVFNTNSTIDVGDNNTNTGDGNIPNAVKKKEIITNLKTRDVQDLIEAQDLY